MTFLGLFTAAYLRCKQAIENHYTYQSTAHLDDRLLNDVGLYRLGKHVAPVPQEQDIAVKPSNESAKTEPLVASRELQESTG